jgi:hypothetical protein
MGRQRLLKSSKGWRQKGLKTLFLASFTLVYSISGALGAEVLSLFSWPNDEALPGQSIDLNIRHLDHLNEKLLGLSPGDRICFEGSCFELGEFLGSGRASQIWALKLSPQYALRLPKGYVKTEAIPLQAQIAMMKSYVLGMKALEASEVAVPRVHHFFGDVAVLIDRKEILFSLREFLDAERFLEATLFDEAFAALKIFMRSTAAFDRFGDFHPDQLHYTSEKKWFLLDIDGLPRRFEGDGLYATTMSLSDVRLERLASIFDGINFRYSARKTLYEDDRVWRSIQTELYQELRKEREKRGLIPETKPAAIFEILKKACRKIWSAR